jgi:hypothetical protein
VLDGLAVSWDAGNQYSAGLLTKEYDLERIGALGEPQFRANFMVEARFSGCHGQASVRAVMYTLEQALPNQLQQASVQICLGVEVESRGLAP